MDLNFYGLGHADRARPRRGGDAEGTGDRRRTGSGVSGAASLIFMCSIRKFPNDFAAGKNNT